jgi:hypothetical protein
MCELYMIPQLFKVWYLEFMGGEGNTFNTTLGCENMVCRLFSNEPLEMLYTGS